jgi:hypothetical protein
MHLSIHLPTIPTYLQRQQQYVLTDTGALVRNLILISIDVIIMIQWTG